MSWAREVVVSSDLFLAVTTAQEIHDQLHGDPGALDHRLSNQDPGIDYDAFTPIHGLISSTTIYHSRAPAKIFRTVSIVSASAAVLSSR